MRNNFMFFRASLILFSVSLSRWNNLIPWKLQINPVGKIQNIYLKVPAKMNKIPLNNNNLAHTESGTEPVKPSRKLATACTSQRPTDFHRTEDHEIC